MSLVRRFAGSRPARAVAFGALALLVPFAAGSATIFAPRSGGMTGHSGKQGIDCTQCHSGGIAPTVTLDGPVYVLHDSTRSYTFTVAGGQQVAAGFNVAVDDGTLAPADFDSYVFLDELTHSFPKVVDSNGEAGWSFDFTAPSAAGPLTLWAAGNSVDFSTDPSGDLPSTTTLVVTVVDSLTSFSEFGVGLAGAGGFVPHLAGVDGPSSGPWSVEIEDGLGGGSGYLLVGLGTTSFPLFKGTCYIDFALPTILLPITLGGTPGVAGDGSLSIDGEDYSSLAPLTVYAQLLMFDAAAPKKISLSNAIEMTVEN